MNISHLFRSVRSTASFFFLVVGVALALLGWFATGHTAVAAANCTVCHKKTTTYTYPCNSIDYARHKSHGDPDGACSASGN